MFKLKVSIKGLGLSSIGKTVTRELCFRPTTISFDAGRFSLKILLGKNEEFLPQDLDSC